MRIYRRYRTPAVRSGKTRPSSEIPGDLEPALVGYLLNGRQVAPASIMATLMDLGRRGFLEFREEYEAGTGFLGRPKWKPRHIWILDRSHLQARQSELRPYERGLLEFVFDRLGGGSSTVVFDVFKKKRKRSISAVS